MQTYNFYTFFCRCFYFLVLSVFTFLFCIHSHQNDMMRKYNTLTDDMPMMIIRFPLVFRREKNCV